jgi:hypothetical protein
VSVGPAPPRVGVVVPVVVRGSDIRVDLTTVLADPSVQVVTITQLELTDACGNVQPAATFGEVGAFFYVTVQRRRRPSRFLGARAWRDAHAWPTLVQVEEACALI